MRLATERIRELARARGLTLGALLQRAGVSRTAYYSLGRRPSVLPRSVHALARVLELPASRLLDESSGRPDEAAAARIRAAAAICAAEPEAEFANVWHTLCLLQLEPVERLNRSLTRGRAAALHR